jgi:hypothetical protein
MNSFCGTERFSASHFDDNLVITELVNAIVGVAAPRQRVMPTNVPHDAIQFAPTREINARFYFRACFFLMRSTRA